MIGDSRRSRTRDELARPPGRCHDIVAAVLGPRGAAFFCCVASTRFDRRPRSRTLSTSTPPKMMKRASLGFDGLMACIYWTRTVQYFGHRHFDSAHTYNQLARCWRSRPRSIRICFLRISLAPAFWRPSRRAALDNRSVRFD